METLEGIPLKEFAVRLTVCVIARNFQEAIDLAVKSIEMKPETGGLGSVYSLCADRVERLPLMGMKP